MSGGKDVEKSMSPMFPRLHVNDTGKGGPRAPPRNKMALYEQLSIPSQRFTTGSASTLLRAQNSSGGMVCSTPSGQASAYPNTFIPFRNCSIPSYMAAKLYQPSSSGGTKENTMTKDSEKTSAKPTNFPTLDTTESSLLVAESDSSQAQGLSNLRNFSFEKYDIEDDVKDPTNDQQSKERKNMPPLSLSSTLQHTSLCENKKLRNSMRNSSIENRKVSQTSQDSTERFSPVSVAGDKDFEDKVSYLLPAADNFERSKPSHAALNQRNNSSIAILNKLHGGKAQPQEEFVALRDKATNRGNILVEPASARGMVKEISSKVRLASALCLRQQHGDERSPEWLENGTECTEKSCRTRMGRHDGVPEISMVDSISALNVLADDVVGVIGEKQFWKARRTITHQQRIFAVQVFELHRLITVQRSFAASPGLLHDTSPYLHKPAPKASLVKTTSLENVVEPLASVIKTKSQSQKPNPNSECNQEDVVRQLPLHPINNNTSKVLIAKQSSYGEHSRKPPSASSTVNKSVPLPFRSTPPGNQWLVPVISPSEGLVYKPYTGPCPQTAGFASPNYGSCGPMSLNSGKAYLGPACNQQGSSVLPGTPPSLGQTYFPPPYALPVTSPFASNSAAEQMSPCGVGRANDQEYQSSFNEINFPNPLQSSCNILSQMNRANPCCSGAIQASKGSELHGSMASVSNPSDRSRGDELPLFPTAPTTEEPDENAQTSKHQTLAIKVVPHNPRSATEAAARIFQSIQEERKHLRLVSS